MANDLLLLAWVALIGGIAFGVYMIIHRHAVKESGKRLKAHREDAANEWIDEEDLGCLVHAAFFMEVDAEGNYLYTRDLSSKTDLAESLAFRDRVAKLQKVVEARLGRIPSRIYFDKSAWQEVKEDRARWQDTAHFCRKVQDLLGRGIQQQLTVDN